jgi:hypothetical protein
MKELRPGEVLMRAGFFTEFDARQACMEMSRRAPDKQYLITSFSDGTFGIIEHQASLVPSSHSPHSAASPTQTQPTGSPAPGQPNKPTVTGNANLPAGTPPGAVPRPAGFFRPDSKDAYAAYHILRKFPGEVNRVKKFLALSKNPAAFIAYFKRNRLKARNNTLTSSRNTFGDLMRRNSGDDKNMGQLLLDLKKSDPSKFEDLFLNFDTEPIVPTLPQTTAAQNLPTHLLERKNYKN